MNLLKQRFFKISNIRYFSQMRPTKPTDWNEGYPTKDGEEEKKYEDIRIPPERSDNYKRDPVESDNDPKEFGKKFKSYRKSKYDVENEKWCKEHHGRYLYYPKYGTSYYDSQEYRKQMY